MGLFGRLFGRQPDAPAPQDADATLVNAYSTLREPPPPDFAHRPIAARDRTDPELLPHLQGLAGYILGEAAPMTPTRWALEEHALRTQRQFSLTVEADAMPGLSDWAARANAILFFPDGTVRDPDLIVLLDGPAGGSDDPAAQPPFPADALYRKAKSRAMVKSDCRLESPDSLPPVSGKGEVVLRSASEVAHRAAALAAVAARAESFNEGDPIDAGEIPDKLPLAIESLTPAEAAFFAQKEPDEQAIADFVWRYEALCTLLWALGLVDALSPDDGTCDAGEMMEIALRHADKSFAAGATLRGAAEILDSLDLHYRLHWSVRQARLDDEEMDEIDPGVIAERHHALNWLTRHRDADWDKVPTPT